ncbi:MAG TPA: PEGA domain-containing protein [Terriglobales bacterium]|nr:PEGA domain-containing protein [Terriglobales bacterium]
MATQIGRFELLSEIAKSDRGCIYKANDSTNGQTVALKTIRLEMPEDQARALSERVQAEADTISAISSPNIAQLYGVGEFENILCAAMEYVQGNSIATMLARKEGFSIWDLLDISRQVCLGFDHAHSRSVVHYSFEPAKVMVQWDGTVKLLSFGISTMGMLPRELSGKTPMVLHYASPEQLRGEPIDPRSNFFSWAAILYEMVTDHKAFDGEDAKIVQHNILEGDPIPPAELNSKIHPTVSDLILKALSKAPDQRFQNGQQLIAELELCKQASTQAAARKSSASPQGLIPSTKVSPGASKPTSSSAGSPAPAQRTSVPSAKTSTPPAEKKSAGQPQTELESVLESSTPADAGASASPAAKRPTPPPPKKAAAAAASGGSPGTPSSSRRAPLDAGSPSRSPMSSTGAESSAKKPAQMSAAAAGEAEAPAKFTVDPMMAEGSSTAHAASFSDLEEMPPLKEVHIAAKPAAEASEPEPPPPVFSRKIQAAKPKVQPRVVAKQAINEIKSVPPRLMMYSVAAAVAVVLAVGVGLAFHWRSQSAEDEGTPLPSVATQAKSERAQPTSSPALPNTSTAEGATPAAADASTPAPAEASSPVEVAPVVKPRYKRKNSRTPARPSIVPGQVALDSTPQGAQVQVDGRTDSGWVTPLTVTELTPGRHTIILSKSGYVSETTTLNIASGGKSSLVLHLAVAGATISVRSDPEGAGIFVDGRDSGRVTPAQISVEKGSHTLLVRKQGFLDETTSANLQSGQNFHFAPSLRPLGNANDIKTVGKFKKIFGGGDTAGMGTVSIKTQPKGAQIAVNRRMLDKASPVQFMVGPGNYIIDITASGYKPIHRVITVERGGKTVLDEVMDQE